MTRDDIIRMARQMGGFYDRHPACINDHFVFPTEESLELFAELIAAVERSACAQVCKERQWQGLTDEDVDEVERWIEFKEDGSGRIPTQKLVRYIERKLKEKNDD